MNLPHALTTLKAFANPVATLERCDLCGVGIEAEHTHLVELSSHRLACACRACTTLFAHADSGRKVVRPRAERLVDFVLDDATWDALAVPIGLAFFVHRTTLDRVVATYPSPAGGTESMLPVDAWSRLVRQNPVLKELSSDVEALLVHRAGPAHIHYRVSVDKCFALVGLVRARWRGLSGGSTMRGALDTFFATLEGDVERGGHA